MGHKNKVSYYSEALMGFRQGAPFQEHKKFTLATRRDWYLIVRERVIIQGIVDKKLSIDATPEEKEKLVRSFLDKYLIKLHDYASEYGTVSLERNAPSKYGLIFLWMKISSLSGQCGSYSETRENLVFSMDHKKKFVVKKNNMSQMFQSFFTISESMQAHREKLNERYTREVGAVRKQVLDSVTKDVFKLTEYLKIVNK